MHGHTLGRKCECKCECKRERERERKFERTRDALINAASNVCALRHTILFMSVHRDKPFAFMSAHRDALFIFMSVRRDTSFASMSVRRDTLLTARASQRIDRDSSDKNYNFQLSTDFTTCNSSRLRQHD